MKNSLSLEREDREFTDDELDKFELQMDFLFDEKKCECGAEKIKTTHSNWCPLYRPIK